MLLFLALLFVLPLLGVRHFLLLLLREPGLCPAYVGPGVGMLHLVSLMKVLSVILGHCL